MAQNAAHAAMHSSGLPRALPGAARAVVQNVLDLDVVIVPRGGVANGSQLCCRTSKRARPLVFCDRTATAPVPSMRGEANDVRGPPWAVAGPLSTTLAR